MRSSTPKVMHAIGGRSLLHHAIAAAQGTEPERLVVVVRHARDRVAAHALEAAPQALVADQDDVPGTGRAVWCGLSALDTTFQASAAAGGHDRDAVLAMQATGPIVVTSADVPLVDADLLAAMLADHAAGARAVTVMTTRVAAPGGYGRIVRDADGSLAAIVEHKDATEEQRLIDEINAGIYVFDAATLRQTLASLTTENAQGELYLTDVVALARAAGEGVGAFLAADPASVEGVNDRAQLAAAGANLRDRVLDKWMRAGVTIVDPSTTWVDVTATLAPDCTILPGTQLLGTTSVATGAVVGPDTTLTNVAVGEGATVTRVHGSDSEIGAAATVGPFSYLRPGTVLGSQGKIGTFVETKNARIGDHSKVPHLSYVGDATIGEHSNIGAATIFVNYDGVHKAHTEVGDHVRIGSDNTLIAPVTIGHGAYTGAGAIIRRDVPAGALSRNNAPQQTIEGWVELRRPGTESADAAAKARTAGGATGIADAANPISLDQDSASKGEQ